MVEETIESLAEVYGVDPSKISKQKSEDSAPDEGITEESEPTAEGEKKKAEDVPAPEEETTETEPAFEMPEHLKGKTPEELAKIALDHQASFTRVSQERAEAIREREAAEARSTANANLLMERLREIDRQKVPPEPKEDFLFLTDKQIIQQEDWIGQLRIEGKTEEAEREASALRNHLFLQKEKLDAKKQEGFQKQERQRWEDSAAGHETGYLYHMSKIFSMSEDETEKLLNLAARELGKSVDAYRRTPNYMTKIFHEIAEEAGITLERIAKVPKTSAEEGIKTPTNMPRKSPERDEDSIILTEAEKELCEKYGVTPEEYIKQKSVDSESIKAMRKRAGIK